MLFLELTFPFGSYITQQTQVSTQKNLFVFDDLDNILVVPTLGTLDPAQVSVTTSPTSPITIPIPPEVVLVPPAATHSPLVRRSTRGSRPPIWHKDYVTKASPSSCIYSIASVLDYTGLSQKYQGFVSKFSV